MTSASPIAFLDPHTAFSRGLPDRPPLAGRLERLDQYDLPEADLDRYTGMVVSSQADQEFLFGHAGRIRAFLDTGRVLVFSGHLCTPWLPGARPFQAKEIDGPEDYHVAEVRDHPVFEGVRVEDLTYQEGVAGFFARGHHPPPPGAEVLVRLRGGEPVVYVDEVTTGGTMLVHSGNDLIGFGGRDSTAARIPRQIVDWIRETSDTGGRP